MPTLPQSVAAGDTLPRVTLVAGTRPEVIKLAPVYSALEKQDGIEPEMLLTGQHREQLQQALSIFDISWSTNLDVMTSQQGLAETAALMLPGIVAEYRRRRPDYVLVHGDTLTTFVAAWGAFLERIPVAHVEAGLRSRRLDDPFPEESNRRLTDALCSILLPPTVSAKENLLAEGYDEEQIVVTGQTGIDSIYFAAGKNKIVPFDLSGPYCVVTLHRRESWDLLPDMVEGLAELARRHPGIRFVYPVHLNPVVQKAVRPKLDTVENFILSDPLDYGEMANLLANARIIITDSGGLQEEGVALGIPVVVCRNVTERPEGIQYGGLHMVGTDPRKIVDTASRLLEESNLPVGGFDRQNPYGDGAASSRVAGAIAWKLGLGPRPVDWVASAPRRARR